METNFYKNKFHAINSIKKSIGRELNGIELAIIHENYTKAELRCELPIPRGYFDSMFPEIQEYNCLTNKN